METKHLDRVVIRFVGDSGDGMQLTGTEFAREAALFGNDFATFPDFPAEIRAPAGTTAGVSGYQIQFASHEVFSPGDAPVPPGLGEPGGGRPQAASRKPSRGDSTIYRL